MKIFNGVEWEIKKFNKEIQALRGLKQAGADELAPARAQNIKQKVLQAVTQPDFRVPQAAALKSVSFSMREKLTRYIVSILTGLSLLGGTAFASDAAKPGDFLYPVKRLSEKVRLGLAASEQSKAVLQERFAEKRLVELEEISIQNPLHSSLSGRFNKGQNLIRIPTSTNPAFSASLNAAAATTSPAIKRHNELEIRARQDAEAAVLDAVKSLEQVQKNFKARGDDRAANSVGNDIVHLRGQARVHGVNAPDGALESQNENQPKAKHKQDEQSEQATTTLDGFDLILPK